MLDLVKQAELRHPYVHVDIYTNKRRSNSLNALYWVWMGQLSEVTGYSSEELHSLMASEFIGKRIVEVCNRRVEYPERTSTLQSNEFIEYMEKVQAFAASELETNLMWPEEYRDHHRMA